MQKVIPMFQNVAVSKISYFPCIVYSYFFKSIVETLPKFEEQRKSF